MHTSTVTVSVINPDSLVVNGDYTKTSDSHFTVNWFSGTGKGGQRRNKVKSCCRVTHTPTGITEVRQGRSRESNYVDAKEAIISKLDNIQASTIGKNINSIKSAQIGTGNRGDQKIRTYRFQDDQVVDHQTGKSAKASKVMKGKFNLLW